MTGCSQESLTGITENSEELASSSSMGTLLSDSEGTYSVISAHFNGTPIKAGSYLWFTVVIQQEGVKDAPVTINVEDANIEFTAGGTNYVVPVPNATLTLDPAMGIGSTAFNPVTEEWETALQLGPVG